MTSRRIDQIPASKPVETDDQIAIWQDGRTRVATIQDLITGPIYDVVEGVTGVNPGDPLANLSLKKAANLSDLVSVDLARQNLGLGSAARLTAGASGGVALYDDPRFGQGGGQSGPVYSTSILDSSVSGRAILTGLPDAARVALQLGTAATKNVGVSGGVAAYDDPRFGTGGGGGAPSTVTASQISDSTPTGRSVITGTAQQGRAALGVDGLLQREFHVNDYGADPTGVADSRAAFLACWAAIQAVGGGRMSMENKQFSRYKFSQKVTLTFQASCGGITLEGAHQEACQLYFPNGGGLEIQFAANRNGMHAKNFTCLTDAEGVGEGLCFKNIYYGSAGFAHTVFNLIESVTCTGSVEPGAFRRAHWARAISMRGTTYVNIVGCATEGGSASGENSTPFGIGIAVSGSPIVPEHAPDQTYGLIYNIKDCFMNSHDIGFLYDNFVQGVTIDATNIGYCRCAISTVSKANEIQPSLLAQLYVTNSQVGANYGNVVEFLVAMFTASFVNCTFFIRTNNYGIYCPTYVPISIDNCVFQGDGAFLANPPASGVIPGTTGIYFGAAAVPGGTVTNCNFNGLGTGLLLVCSGVKFDGLDFKNVDIPIQDNGNNNVYGVNMFGSSVRGNMPAVTVSPKTADAGVGSRDLQIQARRSNGTMLLGKLYLDTDGNLSIVTTENNGTPLASSILNVLHQTLAAKDIRASGALTVQGNASVAGDTNTRSLGVNTNALIAGNLQANGAAQLGSLKVSGNFAVQGGDPVGKQAITGNVTGDINGIRNTLISVIAALLQYNMVTNNTN